MYKYCLLYTSIIQQNPHQILHRPQHQNTHFIRPEELYLYESDDKFATNEKTYRHQYDKTVPKSTTNGETILIHSPNVPNSPGLRVEEILAHLQHKGTNTYVNNEHALQSQLHPNTYRESLLTQHSSHPVIPFGHQMVLNGTHQGLFSLACLLYINKINGLMVLGFVFTNSKGNKKRLNYLYVCSRLL